MLSLEKKYIDSVGGAAHQSAIEIIRQEGNRLNWLLAKLPGDVIRKLVGEMTCTSDAAEWREKIDKAGGFQHRTPERQEDADEGARKHIGVLQRFSSPVPPPSE